MQAWALVGLTDSRLYSSTPECRPRLATPIWARHSCSSCLGTA